MALRFLTLAPPKPPLSSTELDAVLAYMDKAEMILPSTEYSTDPYDPDLPKIGPLLFYSDGEWAFSTEHYEYVLRGHRVPVQAFIDKALEMRRCGLIDSGVSRSELFALFDSL